MSLKTDYEQKFEAKKDQLTAELDKLRAQAKEAGADAKLRLREDIQAIEEKRQAAIDRLKELQASSEDAWEEMRTGVEKAWDDLESAFEKARKKLGL